MATSGFGVGTANAAAIPLVEYGGELYSGTVNEGGAQVWTWDGVSPDWVRVDGDVFGDAMATVRMEVYDGSLYAGTADMGGCGVWSYNGNEWTDALAMFGQSPGFGSTANLAVTAMEVIDGKLFVGLTNFSLEFPFGSQGAEVWSFDGAIWTEELDQPGFGDTENAGVTSLRSYGGSLYAGTAKFSLGVSLIDLDHARISLTSEGCQVRQKIGGSWIQIPDWNLTDENNIAATGMEVYDGQLVIGTANGNVSATYEFSSGNITDLEYDTSGLCIYGYDGSAIEELVTGGFGSADDFAVTAVDVAEISGDDVLLVGTASADGPGKLRMYNGSGWYVGADDGFGDADNIAVTGLATYNGLACAGTLNSADGCEIFRGTLPDPPVIESISSTSGILGQRSPSTGATSARIRTPPTSSSAPNR